MTFPSQMSFLCMLVSSLYRACKISSCSKEGEDQREEVLPSQLTQLICADLDWRWDLHSSSMTLTYLFFQSPFEALFISFIHLILFFDFLLLQCKYIFRYVITHPPHPSNPQKQNSLSINCVSTSPHHELQTSLLHVSLLSLLGTQFIQELRN